MAKIPLPLIFLMWSDFMRIEIKYGSSLGNHPIDLSINELNNLLNSNELLVRQDHPATKFLQITGNADELELLAAALLNKAIDLRHLRT
jgi:hypothetical protein